MGSSQQRRVRRRLQEAFERSEGFSQPGYQQLVRIVYLTCGTCCFRSSRLKTGRAADCAFVSSVCCAV